MSYEEDVRFVGAFIRGGDWEVGLRVARHCDPRAVNGVTLNKFAQDTGVGREAIRLYYKAWELAASDGLVHPSESLQPEDEYNWDERFTSESWSRYYDRARYGSSDVPVGGKRKPTKTDVAHAIKTDPAVALAAREAIAERDANSKSKTRGDAHGKQDSPIEQFTNLHIQLRSAKRALTEALGYVIDIRGVTDTDETRAAVSGYVQQLRHVLDLIDEAAQGKSLDDELAELLEDEDIR